jgi:hypothetical protein
VGNSDETKLAPAIIDLDAGGSGWSRLIQLLPIIGTLVPIITVQIGSVKKQCRNRLR